VYSAGGWLTDCSPVHITFRVRVAATMPQSPTPHPSSTIYLSENMHSLSNMKSQSSKQPFQTFGVKRGRILIIVGLQWNTAFSQKQRAIMKTTMHYTSIYGWITLWLIYINDFVTNYTHGFGHADSPPVLRRTFTLLELAANWIGIYISHLRIKPRWNRAWPIKSRGQERNL
jgi:hypothetical protein